MGSTIFPVAILASSVNMVAQAPSLEPRKPAKPNSLRVLKQPASETGLDASGL